MNTFWYVWFAFGLGVTTALYAVKYADSFRRAPAWRTITGTILAIAFWPVAIYTNYQPPK